MLAHKPGLLFLFLNEHFSILPENINQLLNGHVLYLCVTHDRSYKMTVEALQHMITDNSKNLFIKFVKLLNWLKNIRI